MNRIKLLGLALIATFALGAVAVATASAENPEILPVPTVANPATFTSETTPGTKPTLTSTADTKVKCEKAKNKGEFTSQDAGKVTIDFENCTDDFANNCTSTNDPTGTILIEGSVQLVDVLPTGTLDLGIWIEPSAIGGGDVKFKCGLITVTVLGSVIGVVDNSKGALLKDLEKGKEFIVLWKEVSLGMQEITKCDLLKALCEKGPFELKSSFGAGEELAAEKADAKIVFAKEIEVHF